MSTEITVTDSGVTLTISPTGGGVVGVGIPSGGSTGQVLTKDTATNYDVSWQTPAASVLTNGLSALAVNASVTTSWGTILTANVTQGTWLAVATLTVTTGNNQRNMQFRLFDPVGNATVVSTAEHLEHASEPHNIGMTGLAVIAGTQTLLVQAKMVTGTGTVYASSEGFTATSSNLIVVKVA